MTLETSISTSLDGREIPGIPKTPTSLDDLQRKVSAQIPTLTAMLAFLKTIQSNPGNLFGSTSNFKIEWLEDRIFIGHKDANPDGIGASYSGDLRFGIFLDLTDGMSMGYNNKVGGNWEWVVSLDMSGNRYLLGEHSAGSINGGTVSVSGTTMNDIRTGATRALSIIDSGLEISTPGIYATSYAGVNLSLSGSITGVSGSISSAGAISSVTSVSAPSISASALCSAPVIGVSSYLTMGTSYIARSWSSTGRLTVSDQTSPYAAVGTFTYEFHL